MDEVVPVTKRVVAIDLGKTTCRLRLDDRLELGPGFPGLASSDGADRAVASIAPLLDRLCRASPVTDSPVLTCIGVGAAGAESEPSAALQLARMLRERWHAPTVVGSDVLTAHVGAFDGDAGTVLIMGTGSVALHVDPDGTRARADGWGPWLGDDGSGRWIGQQGLSGALRAEDGRGERTTLTHDAARLAGGLDKLPSFVGTADSASRLASFAPVVLAHAADGDALATHIIDDAAELLAATVAATTPALGAVAVVGGLADHPYFRARIDAAFAGRGLTRRPAIGTALDGAALLAVRNDLPHERYAIRA
ncbi:N-acetylglucosamine kinase [Leifsonia sp. L25]|uniref:N-acetylglucosamine kinase n=1 Tax=Actinomycetes TaxID=1760 RepID=UPI003D687514